MPVADHNSSKAVTSTLSELSASAACAVSDDSQQFIEIDDLEVSCPHSTVTISNNDVSTTYCNAAATACSFAKATQKNEAMQKGFGGIGNSNNVENDVNKTLREKVNSSCSARTSAQQNIILKNVKLFGEACTDATLNVMNSRDSCTSCATNAVLGAYSESLQQGNATGDGLDLAALFNWKTLGIIAVVLIVGVFVYRKITAPPDLAGQMREMMQAQMQMQMMESMAK